MLHTAVLYFAGLWTPAVVRIRLDGSKLGRAHQFEHFQPECLALQCHWLWSTGCRVRTSLMSPGHRTARGRLCRAHVRRSGRPDLQGRSGLRPILMPSLCAPMRAPSTLMAIKYPYAAGVVARRSRLCAVPGLCPMCSATRLPVTPYNYGR